MLDVQDLRVDYGAVIAVRDVSLRVGQGELAALLGANGAGKSSTLLAIAGAHAAASGSIHLNGRDITSATPEARVRAGLAMVPETRDVFPDLTVAENLRLGAYTRLSDPTGVAADREHMMSLFPRLRERHEQAAGTLSGGEQQMLVIARAMMSRPRLLLLDEPSLGLAPTVVTQIFEFIAALKNTGVSILLVEQNAAKALDIADSAYVLRQGSIAAQGTAAEIAAMPDLSELYLGANR